MQLLKKNETAYFNPEPYSRNLALHTNLVRSEDLLKLVDIIAVIRYYGITELLDAIGENELRLHLDLDDSLDLCK